MNNVSTIDMAIQDEQTESQEQAFARLASAVSDVRFAHFVRAVLESGELWCLRDENGWVVFEDANGQECVPVWPQQAFAQLCATDEFAGSWPEAVPLEVFMGRWLPRMAADSRSAAVFPTPANKGVVMPPAELLRELETARKR